ncbi:MAG: hypothetical protein AB7U79_03965 [Candidatus Izemoplasmatales bacterium]
MERIWDVMISDFMFQVLLVLSVVTILFGLLMFIGIWYKGKVIFINNLFKKKKFDQDSLLNKYTIQALYTVFFGVVLYALISFDLTSRTNIWITLGIAAVFDFFFDLFAIKSSIQK